MSMVAKHKYEMRVEGDRTAKPLQEAHSDTLRQTHLITEEQKGIS